MPRLSSLLGGGSSGILPVFAFTDSDTWLAPFGGEVVFHLSGGGGAGYHAGTSGAAGGYCRKKIRVSESDSFSFTIGAGGLGATSGAVNAGSASTLTGTGVSLTANGGGAGTTSTPPTGGTATGGDKNITGGSGSDSFSSNGGGAVGILGVGNASVSNVAGASIYEHIPEWEALFPRLTLVHEDFDVSNFIEFLPIFTAVAGRAPFGVGGGITTYLNNDDSTSVTRAGLYAGGSGGTADNTTGGLGGGGGGDVENGHGGDGLLLIEFLSKD